MRQPDDLSDMPYPVKFEELSIDDWWDFAPWQDMDSAPIGELILAKNNSERPFIVFLFTDKDKNSYTKWLPLPKADK